MFKKISAILVLSCFLFPNIANAFDYEECEKRAMPLGHDEVSKCKHSQMLVDLKKVQDIYDVFANDKNLKFSSTEIKKMYDNWIAYRNTYCNMYAASQPYFTEKYNKEHCLQEQTRNAFLYMRALIDGFYNDPD